MSAPEECTRSRPSAGFSIRGWVLRSSERKRPLQRGAEPGGRCDRPGIAIQQGRLLTQRSIPTGPPPAEPWVWRRVAANRPPNAPRPLVIIALYRDDEQAALRRQNARERLRRPSRRADRACHSKTDQAARQLVDRCPIKRRDLAEDPLGIDRPARLR